MLVDPKKSSFSPSSLAFQLNTGGDDSAPPHVTIVLPCYNEENHVRQEIERICAAMDASGYGYELLAVDDASTDGTLDVLQKAELDFPRLKVVPFRRNSGSGTVRRIGSQIARGEIVVWTDADLTYPNERIPEFVKMLDEDPAIDQVVGARTTEEGTYKFLRVPAKWLIRKIAEWLTKKVENRPNRAVPSGKRRK